VPLDPRVQRFLGFIAAGNPPDARKASVAERRAGLAGLMNLGRTSIPVARVEDRTVQGEVGELPARLYSPVEDVAPLPGLVYFHGGGLVAGSIETHDAIARSLAVSGACRVLSVEYRLAPEYPFPCALQDCRSAIEYVAQHAAQFQLDPERLGIAGDSAGATLAAATCQSLAQAGGPPLALQLLLCPILDYSRATASRLELASGYLVDQGTLDHDLMHYLPPGVEAADPRVSPLLAADIAALPKTIIHTAEFDPLRDEGQNYFERLTRGRIEVSYTCHPGMIHLFYGLGAVIPYARKAFEQIGAQIRGAMADRKSE
jgi:acetyl esterase/lipase